MDEKLIARINALARKSKKTKLSEEELKEQADLRKQYIEAIKGNLRASLNNISIKEEDGSITDLGKKHGGV